MCRFFDHAPASIAGIAAAASIEVRQLAPRGMIDLAEPKPPGMNSGLMTGGDAKRDPRERLEHEAQRDHSGRVPRPTVGPEASQCAEDEDEVVHRRRVGTEPPRVTVEIGQRALLAIEATQRGHRGTQARGGGSTRSHVERAGDERDREPWSRRMARPSSGSSRRSSSLATTG
jgi:hypothetical protein